MEQIDILLATYNGEKFLRQQLDSILSQTYSNFRLLIADDNSKDETVNILKEYENKDSRIIIFYGSENVGYVRNFEFLLEKVENRLYALSDQDDIWLPNKIELAIENMKKNNSDLVFCDLIVIDEEEKVLAESFWKLKGFYNKIKKDKKYKGLQLNNYITGCTMLSKKGFLSDIIPIPKNSNYIIHDYWIAIVISYKGKISYVETPCILYRQHANNQVGYKTKSEQLISFEEVRNLFIDVKIDHFKILEENQERLEETAKKENRKALVYFEKLKNTKYIKVRGWYLFYKLYHYEKFSYMIANFMILNIPIIAKLLYKRR